MLPSAKAGTCHVFVPCPRGWGRGHVTCLFHVPVGGDGDMLCDFVRICKAGDSIGLRVVRWYKATAEDG
jgi:hypothetical protein